MLEKKDDRKIVEIIISGSESMFLKGSFFNENKIIDFRVNFSVGDLSKIDNHIVILPKSIYEEIIICNFKDEIVELNNCIDNNYYVRIWSSHYDVNSYLNSFYVKKECRNKGIGTKLFDICLEYAKNNNYKKVLLSVDPNFKQAISIYQKNGFIFDYFDEKNKELWYYKKI